MGSMKKQLSDEALELIAARFRVLAEPLRLRLLHTLGVGEMSVSDIVRATGGKQANVSKQLGLLTDAGLLARRKEGLSVYYSIADETIFELCETVCGSLEERLAAQRSAVRNFAGGR